MLTTLEQNRERLNLEVSVLSYMVHHNVDMMLSTNNFRWQITRDVFKALNDPKYHVSRKVSQEELDVFEMIFDETYSSCGFYAFLNDVNRLRGMA